MGRKPKLVQKETSPEVLEEVALVEKTAEAGSFEPDISVFRPDREGIRKVLGDLEADTMDYVWDNAPSTGITVREVYEAFRLNRVIAYTTVMSTMARLAKKNLLKVQKIEAAYIYSPAMTREEFIDNFVGRILENLLVSFANTAEAHLERIIYNQAVEKVAALKSRVAQLRTSWSKS